MSTLKALLNDVPVEWKALGDIADLYNGLTGKNKADFDDGNAKFVTYKNIFGNIELNPNTLESVKVSANEKQNEVKYGDVLFTGSSENTSDVGVSSSVTTKTDYKVYLNSFSFGLRFKSDFKLIPEFTKYLFRSNIIRDQIIKTASGVTRYNISKKRFVKVKIPIPFPNDPQKSLAIQQEIVRVLDSLNEQNKALTTALAEEIDNRKKQYEYYREELFRFEGKEVEWKELGDVAEIGTGSHDTKDAVENGKYTFYARGVKPLKLNSYDFDETAIITAGDGVGVGKVFHWVEGKYALHQRAYKIVPNINVNPRYVYYFVVSEFLPYVEKQSVHSSVTSLRKPMFIKFPIVIPSIQEQKRIVDLLDQFDSATKNIVSALEKEIELRNKQYEYYRNLLLSFPK